MSLFAASDTTWFTHFGQYWYLYLIGALLMAIIFMASSRGNNGPGTVGGANWTLGFFGIIFGATIGVLGTIAYYETRAPKADTDPFADAEKYVDYSKSANTIVLKKDPPTGWQIIVGEPGKTGVPVTKSAHSLDPNKSVSIAFDPLPGTSGSPKGVKALK
jgi:hypothetical protein